MLNFESIMLVLSNLKRVFDQVRLEYKPASELSTTCTLAAEQREDNTRDNNDGYSSLPNIAIKVVLSLSHG